MGLTTAMYTSLSGLISNSQAITVAGDNIANINTAGFKSSRVSFENQIVQKLRAATGPADGLGGTNPLEVLKRNISGYKQLDPRGTPPVEYNVPGLY